jgi:hypothetical protein
MPQKSTDRLATDLGYLDRFFDKISSMAAEKAPAERARIEAFVVDQRARWAEMAALLRGPSGAGTAEPVEAAEPSRGPAPSTGPSGAPGPSPEPPAPAKLTVGSLRR